MAELLSIPVIDVGARFNFPNTHPLALSGGGGSAAAYAKESAGAVTSPEDELIKAADVILGLDMNDFYQALNRTDRTTRLPRAIVPETTQIIHIGMKELQLRSWSQHIGKLQPMDLSITADTSVALPALVALCRKALDSGGPIDRKHRFAMLQARHDSLRKEWRRAADKAGMEQPISLTYLAAALWEAVKNCDWVLTNKTLRGWTRRLWDWTSPHQWVSGDGGGGLGHGVGHSIGAALAHRGTGRLCVDIQPDGDFLFTPSALWTAAHHRIPLLVVMYNNRSYYNSENHQGVVSEARGRSSATKGIGTRIDNPPVDFATLARSFGFYAEGPITAPEDLGPTLTRAVQHVQEKNSCALVDVITQPR
jgi:thiamine pyrophosphate-dependent acetolactate synthase large subunit-like protein